MLFSLKAQEVKNIAVKPTGVYAEIDIDGQNRMMQLLYEPKTRNASIDTIFNNITHYNPPVLYLFSQALFLNGEKESAVQYICMHSSTPYMMLPVVQTTRLNRLWRYWKNVPARHWMIT